MLMRIRTCAIAIVASFMALGVGKAQEKRDPILPIKAPFDMPQLQRSGFPNRSVSISSFGAVGDGQTLNTNAIQRAIDACHDAGGGRVIVPAGKWLTTPFDLKSRVELHLEARAEVVFTDDKEYYFADPATLSESARRKQRFIQQYGGIGNDILPRPLISANGCEDIAITGAGKLDGQGLCWWPLLRVWWDNMRKQYPSSVYERAWRGLDPQKTYGRPQMVQPFKCRNVLLEDFTIVNGPFWIVHPVACENVIIRHVRVRSAGSAPNPDSPNTDGINPESCKNVLIEDCDIDTGDDAIAIKSGLDEAGRKRGLPSENIVIRRCRATSPIAIGSEMSGGVRNLLVDNFVFAAPRMDTYVHIKTRRGRGGVVENLWFENLSGGPCSKSVLTVTMEYWTQKVPAPPEPVSERTPRLRNLHFKSIASDHPDQAAQAICINGLPEMPIEGVTFENIRITSKEGMSCNNAQRVTMKNVVLQTP